MSDKKPMSLPFARSVGSATDDHTYLIAKSKLVILFATIVICFLTWAYFATLDEVSTGEGRVVPTKRQQIIQSLEGGVLSSLFVREDEVVKIGQVLAQLDPTIIQLNIEESAATLRAAQASEARLKAEVNGEPLAFPTELQDFPLLLDAEKKLFSTRRRALDDTIHWIDQAIVLSKRELEVEQDLSNIGAASAVDIIRLQRQLAELELKKTEAGSSYHIRAREELAKVTTEINSLSPVLLGRSNSLDRLTIRSPVNGIVKNITVTTIGGVIPANGSLMEIIPLDDQLLIEARISPRDIAYIHPGQRAMVKLSAYDYSIFGGVDGEVVTISPDTIQDEIDTRIFFYRVFIKTNQGKLKNSAGHSLPIVPGMVASVDIQTGQKTVFEYLIKPFNKAREALRER